MCQLILLISTLFVAAYATTGQLSILNFPNSIEFKKSTSLKSELVSDVLGVSLGYSTEHSSDWTGLYIKDPFNSVSCAVVILIDGIDKLNFENRKELSYELVGSDSEDSINSLIYRLEEHNRKIMQFDFREGLNEQFSSIFDNKKIKQKNLSLKPHNHIADKSYLEQISLLESLTEYFQSYKETAPAILLVRLSMGSLVTEHKSSSFVITDAVKLLTNNIDNLVETVKKVFDNNVLISVVTVKNDLFRQKRDTSNPSTRQDVIPEDLNLAKEYSADYPVIFNIILWFGVVMFFALLAISYAIATMDPGRDSVIYRMTSARMKKDN